MDFANRPIGTAAVGYGYWGPNVVRNIVSCPEFRLVSLCEPRFERLSDFGRRNPTVELTDSFDSVLVDDRVEAVAIATPPHTHFDLVSRALQAGKHVLVEKPLADTPEQALALVELAEANDLVLLPGHTFLYSPPVNAVRDLVCNGTLGKAFFVTSSRLNLGPYREYGVIWDLAPHDISILMHVFGERITEVRAVAVSVYREDAPETAFLTFRLANGVAANVEMSCLAPRKVRDMVIVGSERMIQYEDTAAENPVRIYDRGMDFDTPADYGEYRLTYRTGDMVAPVVEAAEPLALELQDFARAIQTGETPVASARLGLEVVRVVEAAQASLRIGGSPVAVPEVPQEQSSEPSADLAPASL